MSILRTIIDQLIKEREYQDQKWGVKFDDANTINDWAAYAAIHIGQAVRMDAAPDVQRTQLLKAATLLIAAVESFERNLGFPKRHYDK